MSLMSMTGCGRGEAVLRGVSAEVDISTINRKQLDVRIQLPRAYSPLEPMVLDAMNASFSRGSVAVTIRIQLSGKALQDGVTIDRDLASAYVGKLRAMGRSLKLNDDLKLSDLVRMPEVLQLKTTDVQIETIKKALSVALKQAIANVRAMRESEGHALLERMKTDLAGLDSIRKAIKKRAPGVAVSHRNQMVRRIAELGVSLPKDDPSLQREMLLFADRSDVEEELTRLGSHLNQFNAMLVEGKPMGRSMDFLCQEILREVNTIGSKANDIRVTRSVIAFKAALEILREQVQNIE